MWYRCVPMCVQTCVEIRLVFRAFFHSPSYFFETGSLTELEACWPESLPNYGSPFDNVMFLEEIGKFASLSATPAKQLRHILNSE